MAADLPIQQVILYKHGVGFFSRAGQLGAGEIAQLDFKSSDMDDVLKSLTVVDASGAAVAGVRYDASEPLERRLEDFPFQVGQQVSLAAFLDQMKGARLELKLGNETVAGAIVSARVARSGEGDRANERETVVLLTDSGDIRSFDLGAASAVRLTDPKLQGLLRDYLSVLSGARSRDKRSVYIDGTSAAARQIRASYMTPAAVWKSSYRLLFRPQGNPLLEGWAIVDNTSGNDWINVNLSVVSGRPISFVTQLYEPVYVNRPHVELAENQPVAPQVFGGAVAERDQAQNLAAAPPPPLMAASKARAAGFGGAAPSPAALSVESSIAADTQGRDLGELFEYSFSNPATVKAGESAMLPFVQEAIDARKLLIYSESFGQNPMNAAEITNKTGKTLDGGPITVYDANAYAGEALVETLKAGDKRLISYGVDLGMRITTAFNSSQANVRELHFKRGILTTKSAIQETKTYSIRNVDPNAKTLIIQHPKRGGYELLPTTAKPKETTADAYRFEVPVPANGNTTFAVAEERVYDQSLQISNLPYQQIVAYLTNRNISGQARQQLEQIGAKKRDIANLDTQIQQLNQQREQLTADQARYRENIDSLRNVAGQQDLVQQYSRQLADAETRLVAMRDQQTQLDRQRATAQNELNQLMETAEF